MSDNNTNRSNKKDQTISFPAKVYTIEEVAAILRIHPETLRKKARQKLIKVFNVSTSAKKAKYRITQQALDEYMNAGGMP